MNAPFRADVIDPFIEAHPHQILFLTASGAHLYGFPSKDSDYDLRGCHIAPVEQLISLAPPRETYEVLDRDAAVEVDLVTHDLGKYLKLLLNKNGYVLEQIFSPMIVSADERLEELRELSLRCLTRYHFHHFRSFAKNQWEALQEPGSATVKKLLYAYRPLLVGITLMREKTVESNIVTLNERFGLRFIDDLVEAKISGTERMPLGETALDEHRFHFEKLNDELTFSSESSGLPEEPAGREAIDDFLVRTRLATSRASLVD
ncbi:MAG: nucleotidyltransferase domain-containing protein [Planctomycetota bacterium]